MKINSQTCRVCGCTGHDCRQCIHKTGMPCSWIEKDLCSACIPLPAVIKCSFQPIGEPDRRFTMSFTSELSPGDEQKQVMDLCAAALIHVGLKNMIVTDMRFTYNLKRSNAWPFT